MKHYLSYNDIHRAIEVSETLTKKVVLKRAKQDNMPFLSKEDLKGMSEEMIARNEIYLSQIRIQMLKRII